MKIKLINIAKFSRIARNQYVMHVPGSALPCPIDFGKDIDPRAKMPIGKAWMTKKEIDALQ